MKRNELILSTILTRMVVTMILAQAAYGAPLGRAINQPPPPFPFRELFETYLLIKTIITSINLVLLLSVFIIYIRIYSNTGSKFSLGLIFFTIALMLKALTSNPILHAIIGFRISGLGPFTILPDLFTLVASAILLYLSRQ